MSKEKHRGPVDAISPNDRAVTVCVNNNIAREFHLFAIFSRVGSNSLQTPRVGHKVNGTELGLVDSEKTLLVARQKSVIVQINVIFVRHICRSIPATDKLQGEVRAV